MIDRRCFLSGTAGLLSTSVFPRLTLAKTAPATFRLIAGPAQKKLYRPDAETSELWTYNGEVPGPEIRVKKRERIRVDFTNNLEEPTSIHWHGIRIDNAMDGVSGLTQQPVQPGDSFLYKFEVPDSGTYWYHAHNKSWNQVGRGLYGPLIVDETDALFDREHDITLVIDDWRLNPENGSLETDSFGSLMDWAHAGRLGNWLTVNGNADFNASLNRGEFYRIRLINASNARIYKLDPNRFGAKVLAYDGQALKQAEVLSYSPLLLGPAQRVDLLVSPQSNFAIENVSENGSFPMAVFNVKEAPVQGGGKSMPDTDSQAPSLAANTIPEPDLANARHVKVDMQGGAMGGPVAITYNGALQTGNDFRRTGQLWVFNGIANIAEEPLFSAKRGETIIIETTNNTAWLHAMHVHGHHFRVISRTDSPVDEGQPWRDTFMIGSEQTTKIAFVADNPGKWLYHCHMLEHAAAGMTTWFEVI